MVLQDVVLNMSLLMNCVISSIGATTKTSTHFLLKKCRIGKNGKTNLND